ncbi:MAG TPA: helix-turn-helix domain-containing protein [Xanthobacteraceae bacterium]|nr:helix-turn-helix domain-containing protein [Xanthobacteraceae bacterium]
MKQLRRKEKIEASPPLGHRLAQIREIVGAINATSEVSVILDQIVFAACHHASWWTSGIMAVNDASGYSELVARYSLSPDQSTPQPTRWALDTSPSRLVVARREPIIIQDAQAQMEFPGYRADAIAKDYHTVVVLPLNATNSDGNELVLAVTSRDHVDVDQEELDFLVTISHLAAIAVNKAKLVQTERAHSARLQGVLDLSGALFSRVLSGGPTETLAAIIENVIVHPLIFLDITSDRIHASRSPDSALMTDREWSEHVQGALAQPIYRLIANAAPSDFRELSEFDLGIPGQPRRAVHVEPMRIDSETVGGVIIFPKAGALDSLDLQVAQKTMHALGAQLIRNHVAFRETAAQVSELMERVIEGEWTSRPALLARAAGLGWDLAERAQLLMLGTTEEADLAAGAAAIIRTIDRLVRRFFRGGAVGMVSDRLLIRVPCEKTSVTQKVLERFVTTLELEAGLGVKGEWVLVRGPIVQQACDYRPALENGFRLLDLARTFKRKGLIADSDFGPFALLLSTLDGEAVPGFVHKTVGAIKAYDERHGTALLETAARFIDHSCRYRPAAKALAIHVSTLRYRIGRLKELFAIDLDDAEARLALALAIRLEGISAGQDERSTPGSRVSRGQK